MSNIYAQPDALTNGKTLVEIRAEGAPEEIVAHKIFYDNRQSLSLFFERLAS